MRKNTSTVENDRTSSGFGRAVLRRIGLGLLTLWGASIITFVLLFLVPAEPAQVIGGERATPEVLKNIRAKYGLDRPLPVQYGIFVRDIATNELRSYRNDDKVLSAIARRFPATLVLALAGLSIWLLVSIPLGLLTARYAGTPFDRTSLILGLVALSIPTFWLGRLLQHYLGYRWGLFSVGGGASLANLPLPAITLGLGGAALYSRLLHANVRGVLKQDFIRAARARGLDEKTVLGRHALRNALIPLVSVLGMDIASLLSGLVFTENIFGWPGIGSLAVDSARNFDAPMIMGTVLFSSFLVVLAGIAIDIAYRLIDPRVRVS
ncbi:MAG TPA: ABC transporter permease [Abditibacteriaceae bacterium]|jgi:peptide/nickel transport system permease protein